MEGRDVSAGKGFMCAGCLHAHTHGGEDAHTHAWVEAHTHACALPMSYIGLHFCFLPHFHSTGAVHSFSLLAALRLPSSNPAPNHVNSTSNLRYTLRVGSLRHSQNNATPTFADSSRFGCSWVRARGCSVAHSSTRICLNSFCPIIGDDVQIDA